MKKIGLIMPLIAVPLLASCGFKIVDPYKIDLYKKEFIYDETGKNIYSIIEYEYNSMSLSKKETSTNLSTPNIKDVYEYTYDEHENEVGLHYSVYDNEQITDEGWMLNTYVYDKQNRITNQAIMMSFDYKTWDVLESYGYEYIDNVKIEKNYDGSGSLDYTMTYTYDEKGNLINKKTIYAANKANVGLNNDYEEVYTVNENGCTTKIEQFLISSSGGRENLNMVTEITYLNNLWYRPLKKIEALYTNGQPDSYTTYEYEYDAKSRLILNKIYDGTNEGATPSYYYYATYEY